MPRLTYNPLPSLARMLEEERADADEAVRRYERRVPVYMHESLPGDVHIDGCACLTCSDDDGGFREGMG